MSKLLLQITIAPKMEDTLVDWLLQQPQHLVFTCYKVNQYGQALDNVTDSVRGYQQRIIFDIEIPEADWEALKSALQNDFAATQLSYRAITLQDCSNE